MNKIVDYLESKNAIFHSALVLIVLYVPHAGIEKNWRQLKSSYS